MFVVTREDVIEAIKQCYDPEIPVNVYDLGLVYDVTVNEEKVKVTMTLTSQGCPSARQIPDMMRARILALPSVKDVDIQVVWSPEWSPSMISPEGKRILKLEDES